MTNDIIDKKVEAHVALEYLNGLSLKELATEYDLTKYQIVGIIRDHNLPARKSGGVRFLDEWKYHEIHTMWNYGSTVTEICEKMDLRPKQVEMVIKVVDKNPDRYKMLHDHAVESTTRMNDLRKS